MGFRVFSSRNRPFHLGPFPLERFRRRAGEADLSDVPAFVPLDFRRLDTPHSLVNAMGEYQAMMDAIRDGLVNPARAEIPDDPRERAEHVKAFGYFSDASMMGICRLPAEARLEEPVRNPEIDRLAKDLRTRQTKTLASGIDLIMADLKDAMEAPPGTTQGHSHAIVCLYEHYRAPERDEPGGDWILDAQDHRACLRATETAVVMANYLRLLGYEAKAHSATSSDVDPGKLAVAAGAGGGRGRRPRGAVSGHRLRRGGGDHEFRDDARRAAGADGGTSRGSPRRDRPGGWARGLPRTRSTATRSSAGIMPRAPCPSRSSGGSRSPPPSSTNRASPGCRNAPTCSPGRNSETWGARRCRMNAKGVATTCPQDPRRQLGPAEGAWAPFALHSGRGRWRPMGHRNLPTPQRNAANIKAASYFLGIDAVGHFALSRTGPGTATTPPASRSTRRMIRRSA